MEIPDWLAEIDAREKAATRGPWRANEFGIRNRNGQDVCQWGLHRYTIPIQDDCQFMAHSRTDAPLKTDMLRLLAETLEYIAGSVGKVSDKDAARAALATYRSGKVPIAASA